MGSVKKTENRCLRSCWKFWVKSSFPNAFSERPPTLWVGHAGHRELPRFCGQIPSCCRGMPQCFPGPRVSVLGLLLPSPLVSEAPFAASKCRLPCRPRLGLFCWFIYLFCFVLFLFDSVFTFLAVGFFKATLPFTLTTISVNQVLLKVTYSTR